MWIQLHEKACHSPTQKEYTFYVPLLVLLATMLLGCQQHSDPWLHDSYWTCHTDRTWSDQQIQDSLLGRWSLLEEQCPSTIQQAQHSAQPIDLVFGANGSGMQTGGVDTFQFDWSIYDRTDSPLHQLHLAPRVVSNTGVEQVYYVLFCGQGMELNKSFTWGCNQFFERQR